MDRIVAPVDRACIEPQRSISEQIVLARKNAIRHRSRVHAAIREFGEDAVRHCRSGMWSDHETLRRRGDMLRKRAMRCGPAIRRQRCLHAGEFRQRREQTREISTSPLRGNHRRPRAIEADPGGGAAAPQNLRQIHAHDAREPMHDHGSRPA